MAAGRRRIQPCNLNDGEHFSLLHFAYTAAHNLDPNFNPPNELIAEEGTEGMQDTMRFYKRWGNTEQGFETIYLAELEPRASATVVDRLQLKTVGLPRDCSLEMETARQSQEPRYIEISVEGPDEAVKEVLEQFSTFFGGDYSRR